MGGSEQAGNFLHDFRHNEVLSIDQQKLLKMFKENELIDDQYLSNRYLLLTRNRRALIPGQKK